MTEGLVLGYLLKYGTVLETLSISVAEENGSDLEQLYRQCAQMLLHFQRASDCLRILIS